MKTGKNFTLLELLVTIAIIMILASLLLPALRTVKEKSKAIVCSGNLMNIGKTVMLYSSDYNEWVLPCRMGSATGVWWMASVWAYLSGNRASSTDGNILVCPAGKYEAWEYYSYYSSYGYNERCGHELDAASVPAYGFVKMTKVRFQTKALLITDQKNKTASNPLRWDGDLFTVRIDRRHAGGSNLLFLDGHVQWGKYITDDTPCTPSGFYWICWANSPGQ